MGSPSIADFLDLMADTVTINPFTGHAVSGASSFNMTDTRTYPARIEMKNRLIVDNKGREIMARGRIYLGPNVDTGAIDVPDVRDLLTLPGRYAPTTPPILAVNAESDENSVHHVELAIG